MATERVDEVLEKALVQDTDVVPRYTLVLPNGEKVAELVTIELQNKIARKGMPINRQTMNECLAASGVTTGSSNAYVLNQPGFVLFDGATVRLKLHADSGATPTLNINNTGARKLMIDKNKPIKAGTPAGTWMTFIYSSDFDFFLQQGSAGETGRQGSKMHSAEFEAIMGWSAYKAMIRRNK